MMKKFLSIIGISILVCIFSYKPCYAESNSFELLNISNDNYVIDGLHFWTVPHGTTDDVVYVGDVMKNVCYYTTYTSLFNGEYVAVWLEWENPEYVIIEGKQTQRLICTDIIRMQQFYLEYEITGVQMENTGTVNNIKNSKTNNSFELLEDDLSPTLSSNNIILDIDTKYDINIENKIKGTTYEWITDNAKIATVNSKNGIVNAISEGTTTITCQMTNGDEVSTLSATVNVIKLDDDYPSLTETELELETDDFFDINITNKIKGSKYYWTSSDKTIAKVNSSNGKVTTISEGDVIITCTIITLNGDVYVRKCDVSVVDYSRFEENDIEE